MSRIGKIPVEILKDVKVAIETGRVRVEGPKGKLDLAIPRGITVSQKDNKLVIERQNDSKQSRADHGTVRARLRNMVIGVSKGHKKDLEIQGIGFRAQLQGNKVTFNLGLSHPVEYEVPSDVKVQVPTQTAISIEGADPVLVGMVAAQIRDLKPVEPYKGKGIRYVGEIVRRKQGKSATK